MSTLIGGGENRQVGRVRKRRRRCPPFREGLEQSHGLQPFCRRRRVLGVPICRGLSPFRMAPSDPGRGRIPEGPLPQRCPAVKKRNADAPPWVLGPSPAGGSLEPEFDPDLRELPWWRAEESLGGDGCCLCGRRTIRPNGHTGFRQENRAFRQRGMWPGGPGLGPA
jgi:hypothetical protein